LCEHYEGIDPGGARDAETRVRCAQQCFGVAVPEHAETGKARDVFL
jgi:hypothetical protein